MKEYKIQMRFAEKHDGKWVSAKNPNGTARNAAHPYTHRSEAEYALERLRKYWPEYAEKWNLGVPVDHQIKELPIDYRIISREVTEWKPE